jgi:hypothetical protein
MFMLTPKARAMHHIAIIVTITWREPNPNTCLRMAMRRSNVNSRPIINNRKNYSKFCEVIHYFS